MAAETYSSPECSNGKAKRKRLTVNKELERLDSLPWNPSFPDNKDTRSFLVGSNNLEGGFLSLEEIDEFEYGLEIPSLERESKREKFSKYSKTTKKKWKDDGDNGGDESLDVIECGNKDGANELKDVKKEMKKKKKKKTMKLKEARKNAESVTEMQVDETEFYAWNELRLDPLLMKSIHRLGFKEPTPIQKACIPAAAHRGKDVVGAAETGSGKTLAFGLPILQRLLEEREKVAKLLEEKVEMVENYASEAFLRALIVTPTRELALQVTDHLKNVAQGTGVRVVPVVGGMSMEKQERLLKARPEIVVGTPGRLWELISGGENHLAELHSLSFFVLDEADRMIESGHFHELQSIIDMLPMNGGSIEQIPQTTSCATFSSAQRKKRQTLFFSATVALSSDFRKKLKRGSLKSKHFAFDGLNSIETLSQRAGMKPDAAIIDLTNESILAKKLEEAFIECREEDKDAYLYYILSFHGQGRTIVFCTSIAALRHISSLLHILKMDNVFTLHAQMQQRARLKAIDRFRGHECGVLVATDVAARGLDVPGVRTVVHYQLPHSADVYVHRSGRTARASSDGCSVALISPKDRSKFASLCKSFSKETFWRFPLDDSYMRDIIKRLSLACQIDKISRKDSQEKAKKGWFEKNAEAVGLVVDENDNEEERASSHKKKKASSMHLERLKQELGVLLSRSLRPGTFTAKYPAAAGVPLSVQCQFEELAKQRKCNEFNKKRKTSVIGRDCVEAIDALRCDGLEVHIDVKEAAEKRRKMEDTRRKRKQQKTRIRDLRRKQRKRDKELIE